MREAYLSPTISLAWAGVMLTSFCPNSALVDGVYMGWESRSQHESPGGCGRPWIVWLFSYLHIGVKRLAITSVGYRTTLTLTTRFPSRNRVLIHYNVRLSSKIMFLCAKGDQGFIGGLGVELIK